MKTAYQIYSDLLFLKAGKSGISLSGSFELTSRCNLDCKMCYIHRRANDEKVLQKEKTASEWLYLAEECCNAGTLLVLLTGGEPLLRSDFKEIYTGCRKLGMMVSINTNATLIDEKMVEFLSKEPPVRVNITLYGASPETYGKLCGDPSAYSRVVNAILSLKAAGIMVKVNYSATPYNCQDAEKVYEFTKQHKLALQATSYMFPPVRACEQGCFTADRMTAEESAMAQMIYDRFRFEEDELKARWQAQMAGVQLPDPDKECQELPTERIRCRAGESTFWVTWDGQIRPCGMMVEPSVKLEKDMFSECWQRILAARQGIMVPPKCTKCEVRHMCDQCAAICYAETGSFLNVPEYMCKKTKAYLKMAEQELCKEL